VALKFALGVIRCIRDVSRNALLYDTYLLEISENGRNTTFYQSAIVNIVLSCTIFKLQDVEECCDLEGSLKVCNLTRQGTRSFAEDNNNNIKVIGNGIIQ